MTWYLYIYVRIDYVHNYTINPRIYGYYVRKSMCLHSVKNLVSVLLILCTYTLPAVDRWITHPYMHQPTQMMIAII
jgi:hypothetical protein